MVPLLTDAAACGEFLNFTPDMKIIQFWKEQMGNRKYKLDFDNIFECQQYKFNFKLYLHQK